MTLESHPSPAAREGGFLLVGVIMFVLALTILGLSLFSLSSFEAQFLARSTRSTQALYDATSGLEWAKIVLAKERRLQAVQDGAPAEASRPPRVTYVEAWQGSSNTGNINYNNGVPVRIRARGEGAGGVRRLVELMYEPTRPDTLYGAIVDSYDSFEIPEQGGLPPPTPRRDQTFVNGPVRVRNDYTPDWRLAPGAMLDWGGNVPQPKISQFTSQHWNAPGTQPVNGLGSPGLFELLGTDPTGVNFFKTPGVGGVSILERDSPSSIIRVANTCVWLLDQGARFNGSVSVEAAGPNPRLVIVAGGIRPGALPINYAYNPPPAIGLWFFSSLRSASVPIVLVSDAQVILENSQQTAETNVINDLTIWADGVRIMGPEAGFAFRAYHTATTDAIIQELGGKGALPGGLGNSSSWIPLRGTWRELDPDNPDPS